MTHTEVVLLDEKLYFLDVLLHFVDFPFPEKGHKVDLGAKGSCITVAL